MTTTPRNWRTHAACRHEDLDLFFPIGNTGPALLQIEEAKTVCRRCPVQEECLNWAIDQRIEHGVFGGLAEDERRTMLRRKGRRRASQSTPDVCPQNSRILEALATGLDVDDITARLGIPRRTVNDTLRRYRQNLGVDTNDQITAAAYTAGLIDINGAAA